MKVETDDNFKQGKQYESLLFAKIGESLYEIECSVFSLLWFDDKASEITGVKKEKIKTSINTYMRQLKVLLRYIEKFDVLASEKVCMNCVRMVCGVDGKATTFDNRCLSFKNKAGEELNSLWETEKTLIDERKNIDKEIEEKIKEDMAELVPVFNFSYKKSGAN